MDRDKEKDIQLHKIPLRKNISEAIYGAISKSVSVYIAKTSLTPNQITLISGIFGVIGAIFLILQERLYLFLAGIFIQLYCILDVVDGDIARLKRMQSLFGKWLDNFFDKLNDLLLILGLSLGVYFQTREIYTLYLGTVLMGLIFFVQISIISNSIILTKLEKEEKHTQQPNKTDRKNFGLVCISKEILKFIGKHLLLEHCTFLVLISFFAIINRLFIGLWFITIHAGLTLIFITATSLYKLR